MSGTIPVFRPVTLEDKTLFDSYLSRYPQETSEYSFATIFAWAELYHTLFAEYKEHLLISFRGLQDCHLGLAAPVGPHPEKIMKEGITGFTKYCWERIPDALKEKITCPVRFHEDRDNADYIYLLKDLRELPGRKYDGKRNFIRKCETLAPEVKPLFPDMILDAIQIQEAWLAKKSHDPSATQESTALIKALENFDELHLSGIGVFIEGRLAGFAVGEELNPTTFVEHYEKADGSYSGIYPFLLRAFARSLPEKYLYLNREEDLGIPGLRKAKMSWHPHSILIKWKCPGKSSSAG